MGEKRILIIYNVSNLFENDTLEKFIINTFYLRTSVDPYFSFTFPYISTIFNDFFISMSLTSKIQSFIPVLRKVCESFGDKMNLDFLQVMCILSSEQPWNRFLNLNQSFLPPIDNEKVIFAQYD